MFELKKEKVEIVQSNGNKEVYEISPLTGEYLQDLYSVIDIMQSAGSDDSSVVKALSTEASTKLHRLVFASLRQSYPKIEDATLNMFVSQNLFKFIEAVMKVNMPQE